MEYLNFELTEENRKQDFVIDPEDAYFELVTKTVGSNAAKTDKRLYASVKISIKKTNESILERTVEFNNQESSNFNAINEVLPLVMHSNVEKISLEFLEGNTLNGFSISFEGRQGKKMIDMHSPLEQFNQFISDRINSKILFSAPFGSGKSTFLNHYFNDVNHKEYNVFTLYPVNYSVASNEDIFTYIKADLLLQLLATGVEFDKEEISKLTALEEYIYFKPKKAILSFLEKISYIHPTTTILSRALKSLNEIVHELEQYQNENSTNDKEKTIQYIKELYEKEGSLFEDNFFTQLIRQLLGRLSVSTEKPTVLVIEDLDRIDPDHIFRILNLISAHYDLYKFSDDNEIYSNKFGFDKIIIVSDIVNIENIFHHKYGPNTDFKGYINKFFSRTPFYYDNKQQISSYIQESYRIISNSGRNNPYNEKLIELLKLFNENDLIHLREIIKINTLDFNDFELKNIQPGSLIVSGPYTKALMFLNDFYGNQKLLSKIERLKSNIHFQNFGFQEDSKILLASLGMTHEGNVISAVGNSIYTFTFDKHYEYRCIYNVQNIKCFDSEMNDKPIDLTFHTLDFYKLLIENIKRININ